MPGAGREQTPSPGLRRAQPALRWRRGPKGRAPGCRSPDAAEINLDPRPYFCSAFSQSALGHPRAITRFVTTLPGFRKTGRVQPALGHPPATQQKIARPPSRDRVVERFLRELPRDLPTNLASRTQERTRSCRPKYSLWMFLKHAPSPSLPMLTTLVAGMHGAPFNEVPVPRFLVAGDYRYDYA